MYKKEWFNPPVVVKLLPSEKLKEELVEYLQVAFSSVDMLIQVQVVPAGRAVPLAGLMIDITGGVVSSYLSLRGR